MNRYVNEKGNFFITNLAVIYISQRLRGLGISRRAVPGIKFTLLIKYSRFVNEFLFLADLYSLLSLLFTYQFVKYQNKNALRWPESKFVVYEIKTNTISMLQLKKNTISLTFLNGLLYSVGPRLDTCLVQWEGEGAVGGGGQGGGADTTTRGAAEGAQGEQPPFYHSGAGETAQRANGKYLESTITSGI